MLLVRLVAYVISYHNLIGLLGLEITKFHIIKLLIDKLCVIDKKELPGRHLPVLLSSHFPTAYTSRHAAYF